MQILNYNQKYFKFIYELNKAETSKFRSDVVWDKTAYQNNIDSGVYGEVFVILENNSPVGFYSVHRKIDSIYLHKLFIAEKYQRRGIGKKVIDLLKAQSKEIECQAHANNQTSIRFFISQDFQTIERNKDDIRLFWKA